MWIMPIVAAPLIWLGVGQTFVILIWVLSLFGLVAEPEGAEFEARLHLVSAGATALIVLMLYGEILGFTDFIEWL